MGRWSLPMSWLTWKLWSVAERSGDERARSSMLMVEFAEWMCVGSSLLRIVRLVVSSISLSVIPDLFVVLQLKSLCLALKSPIMSMFLFLLVMVLMSFPEGCIPGGQYIDETRRVVDVFKSSVVAMYSLCASSSCVRLKRVSLYSILCLIKSATPPPWPVGRSFLRILKPSRLKGVSFLRRISLMEATVTCFSVKICFSSLLFFLIPLMLMCKKVVAIKRVKRIG